MTAFLEALLSGGSRSGEAGGADGGTGVPLEKQFEALGDMARRVASKCPYQTGDAVTVRPGMDVKGAGKLHVVVEVFDTPVTDRDSEPGSNRFLNKYTMRVAHFCGDSMTIHAVDHAAFEPWTEAHTQRWNNRDDEPAAERRRRIAPDAPLQDVVRMLRDEGRRLADAKITWKKGELVEIIGHEASNAARPMRFSGRAIGLVETVDFSDDTTRVIYFDEDGRRRSQWFTPVDLRPFAAVEPVSV